MAEVRPTLKRSILIGYLSSVDLKYRPPRWAAFGSDFTNLGFQQQQDQQQQNSSKVQ